MRERRQRDSNFQHSDLELDVRPLRRAQVGISRPARALSIASSLVERVPILYCFCSPNKALAEGGSHLSFSIFPECEDFPCSGSGVD